VIRAAENKRSPLIIQVFPWAITATDGLLIRAAAEAASRATVPIAIHLDHCQDEALVRLAADTLPFDSIMVDMSHHEKAENLAKTKELVAYCHARGIACEAEPGRIEGGEDGVADTEAMEGVLTTPEEVEDFIATGVDFLAPAVGNVHGEYGPKGPDLDYPRWVFCAGLNLTSGQSSFANKDGSKQTRSHLQTSRRPRTHRAAWHQRFRGRGHSTLYRGRRQQNQC
jgi:fructose-bisphosphate aldolase class II